MEPGMNADRGILSTADRRRGSVRAWLTTSHVVLFLAVALAGAGPVLWLVKSSITDTQTQLREPLRLWPADPQWNQLVSAWQDLNIGQYLWNTVVLVGGSWFTQVLVATTAGYALSVVRPWFGRYVYAAILATLFVPGTVSMVALYLTIIDLPVTGGSIANTPLAIWLPAGAHAFNVLIAKQFFDGIPAELYEAAEIDGAGPFTVFRRIVLPMSTPIIAVISLLSIMSAWKDFLWPLIAITDPAKWPLGVALPNLANDSDQALLHAGLLIATVPPVLIFLIFQRQIVRGIGFTGLKG
jgi:multiple sugar transport system permease protein